MPRLGDTICEVINNVNQEKAWPSDIKTSFLVILEGLKQQAMKEESANLREFTSAEMHKILGFCSEVDTEHVMRFLEKAGIVTGYFREKDGKTIRIYTFQGVKG